MLHQMLLFMLAFLGVMLAGPAIVLLWGFLFKIDAARLLAEHRMLCTLAFGGYGMFVALMFFVLQDRFIVFRPEPGSAPLGKARLIQMIEESFTRPIEGQRLFEVARAGDRLVVTWSGSLDYFQGIAVGGRGMKRVVVLTFDEAQHRAFFIMKERDYKWNASLGVAELSMRFSNGIFAEFRTEAYPSIDFSPQEGLRVEIKKLSYNSEELMQPILKAVLGAGWSLHGGMVPGLWFRLLFALPVGLLFLGVGLLVTTLVAKELAPPADPANRAESRQELPDLDSQLAQVIPAMRTEMLAAQIEGIIRTPPEHLQERARRALAPYLNAYMRREDRREDLVREALAQAERLKLAGIDVPAGTR